MRYMCVTLDAGKTATSDGLLTDTGEPSSYAIYEVDSKDDVVNWTTRFLGVRAEHWPGWAGHVQVYQALGPEDLGPPA